MTSTFFTFQYTTDPCQCNMDPSYAREDGIIVTVTTTTSSTTDTTGMIHFVRNDRKWNGRREGRG